MSRRKIVTETVIHRSAADVYRYVTSPSEWHEWFPSSLPTGAPSRSLRKGERFDVATRQKPISFLPYEVRRSLTYEVINAVPGRAWQVIAHSPAVDTDTSYELIEVDGKTQFRRVFFYEAKGFFKLIEPILLRGSIERQAATALVNLKRLLESMP